MLIAEVRLANLDEVDHSVGLIEDVSCGFIQFEGFVCLKHLFVELDV